MKKLLLVMLISCSIKAQVSNTAQGKCGNAGSGCSSVDIAYGSNVTQHRALFAFSNVGVVSSVTDAPNGGASNTWVLGPTNPVNGDVRFWYVCDNIATGADTVHFVMPGGSYFSGVIGEVAGLPTTDCFDTQTYNWIRGGIVGGSPSINSAGSPSRSTAYFLAFFSSTIFVNVTWSAGAGWTSLQALADVNMGSFVLESKNATTGLTGLINATASGAGGTRWFPMIVSFNPGGTNAEPNAGANHIAQEAIGSCNADDNFSNLCNSGVAPTSVKVQFPYDIKSTDCLVGVVSEGFHTDTMTVSGTTSGSWTAGPDSHNYFHNQIFYKSAGAAGTDLVTAANNQSGSNIWQIHLYSLQQVTCTPTASGVAHGSGGSPSVSSSGSVSSSTGFVLAGFFSYTDTTWTAGAGYTMDLVADIRSIQAAQFNGTGSEYDGTTGLSGTLTATASGVGTNTWDATIFALGPEIPLGRTLIHSKEY